jgi:hypothetical protein
MDGAPLIFYRIGGSILPREMRGGMSDLFDNSVPPRHNFSPFFRMKKIPVCLLVLMSKNLVRGGDFAIELS